jgi:hypothetical protein
MKDPTMRMIHTGWRWFRRWLRGVLAKPYRSEFAEGWVPSDPVPHVIYIVRDDGIEEHVAFICPCGCGDLIQLNLIPDERPCWRLMCDHKGKLTLHPSVWRTKGCHAHFWVKRNRIWWCAN